MIYKVSLALMAFFISFLMSLISGNVLLTSLKRGLMAFIIIYIVLSIAAWIMKKEIEIYNYKEPKVEPATDIDSESAEKQDNQASGIDELEAELGINIDDLDLDNLDPEEMANVLRTMSTKDE